MEKEIETIKKEKTNIGKTIKNSILIFALLLVVSTILWISISPGIFIVWIILTVLDLALAIYLAIAFQGMVSGFLDKQELCKLNKQLSKEKDLIKREILQSKIDFIVNKNKFSGEYGDSSFSIVMDNFKKCLKMSEISIINEETENQESREWAKVIVDSKAIKWEVIKNPLGIPPSKVPCLHISQNHLLILFPSFFVQSTSVSACAKMGFSAYKYTDLQASYYDSRMSFHDDEKPRDSEIIDYTWEHVNNNGSQDLRFNDNARLPICKMGSVDIVTPECSVSYMTSQTEPLKLFIYSLHQLSEKPTPKTADKEKQKVESTAKVKANNESVGIIFPEISKVNFDNLIDSIKRLNSILSKMKANDEVVAVISENCFENKNEKSEEDIAAMFYLASFTDLIYGHLSMEHNFVRDKRYELGLYEFLYCREKLLCFPYKYPLYDTIIFQYEEDFDDAMKVVKEDDDMEFCLSKLLIGCSNELLETYKIALYRYFSCASKLDGVITDKEKKFLSGFLADQNEERKTLPPKLTLDELVGMNSVKAEIKTLTNFIKVQKMRSDQGMKTTNVSYHLVFTGNPGTGKTTVARIVADIYKELGVLKKGHLVETDRSGLIAEYVGQTAVKTNKIIDSALDGVLFIDEAYALCGGTNDFGPEAVATLLKRMEDDRDRLVVIIAGYTNEINKFLESNPGMKSRFNRFIDFPDYSAEDLMMIFKSYLRRNEYSIADDANDRLYQYIKDAVDNKDEFFGNARFVRNIFEKVIESQANRLATSNNMSKETLSLITVTDINLKNI